MNALFRPQGPGAACRGCGAAYEGTISFGLIHLKTCPYARLQHAMIIEGVESELATAIAVFALEHGKDK